LSFQIADSVITDPNLETRKSPRKQSAESSEDESEAESPPAKKDTPPLKKRKSMKSSRTKTARSFDEKEEVTKFKVRKKLKVYILNKEDTLTFIPFVSEKVAGTEARKPETEEGDRGTSQSERTGPKGEGDGTEQGNNEWGVNKEEEEEEEIQRQADS
jgi:hypothetical protein